MVRPYPLSELRTGLLVSVRNQHEAQLALDSGADVIDVKEPARGPLGRADAEVVRGVVERIAGRRPVTAAAGDLGELSLHELQQWAGLARPRVIKLGLPDARSRDALDELGRFARAAPQSLVAAALYADRLAPSAIDEGLLRRVADATSAGWVVVDTHDKQQGDLLDAWGYGQLIEFLSLSADCGLRVVLAGGLRGVRLASVLDARPGLIGVRGAACRSGRVSELSASRIAQIRQQVRAVWAAEASESGKKT